MSWPRPGSPSGNGLFVSSPQTVSVTSSAANDQPLATSQSIGGNGTALLAVLVAGFAIAVTGVVAVAGIRSSRRRY